MSGNGLKDENLPDGPSDLKSSVHATKNRINLPHIVTALIIGETVVTTRPFTILYPFNAIITVLFSSFHFPLVEIPKSAAFSM